MSISIHALLAESDNNINSSVNTADQISLHALLAESDFGPISAGFIGGLFLSTLSLRRATRVLEVTRNVYTDFYPRSPCGERPLAPKQNPTQKRISIHALLAESDETLVILPKQLNNFYPRSPCGERLVHALKLANLVLFLSTLSLRRATAPNHNPYSRSRNFYPRSPCGERR